MATMAALVRRQLLTMARYNIWATTGLLNAVGALSDEEYYRDVGLFFKSVHGTLNHLVVAEHDVWYTRIHDGVFPRGLDLGREAEHDRTKLKETLMMKAQRWLPLLETISDERLTGDFNYTSTDGDALSLPLMDVLFHVFNHGTHHRGQITAALTMLRHESPSIDLVYMMLEEKDAEKK